MFNSEWTGTVKHLSCQQWECWMMSLFDSICRNDDLKKGGELASSNHNVNIILHVAYRCQALSRWLRVARSKSSPTASLSLYLWVPNTERRTTTSHCAASPRFSAWMWRASVGVYLFSGSIYSMPRFQNKSAQTPQSSQSYQIPTQT